MSISFIVLILGSHAQAIHQVAHRLGQAVSDARCQSEPKKAILSGNMDASV
jgi:hypothetical protein